MDKNPFRPKIVADSHIYGSCHGLVLLKRSRCNHRYYVTIWNPLTSEFKDVPVRKPRLDNKIPDGLRITDKECLVYATKYGFGYDDRFSINDYKLVRVRFFYDSVDRAIYGYEAKVYSLALKSWKTIIDIPCVKFFLEAGGELNTPVFVNGVLPNCIVICCIRDKRYPTSGNGVIVVFNIEHEYFMSVFPRTKNKILGHKEIRGTGF
ncbi:uncharacterized protein LOC113290490 [Papaver somniferum]|uniref:uncharacterized protein LOC113290490 n=1 Tax=Papaver somniferum TaxID=3469 RepID=UPI000E6F6E79|nr:uncharacterized protein LOC113290490 [Papaver somniferum]